MNRDDMMIKMVAKTLTRRVLHCWFLGCCIALLCAGRRHSPTTHAL